MWRRTTLPRLASYLAKDGTDGGAEKEKEAYYRAPVVGKGGP